MAVLNINNFSILEKLLNSKEHLTILLGQKPMLYMEDGLIRKIDGNDVTLPLKTILSSDMDIVVVSGAGSEILTPANDYSSSDERTNTLPYALAHTIAELPQEMLGGKQTENIAISYKDKLNYKAYAYYLTSTDVMVSPILYQWLEGKFKHTTQHDKINFNEINSQLSHLSHNATKEILIKTIFVLVSLGFINLHFGTATATTTPQEPTATPQQATATAGKTSGRREETPDKISVAKYIADNFIAGNYNIAIEANNDKNECNLAKASESGILDITIKDFLSKILSAKNFKKADAPQVQTSPEEGNNIKLKTFSQAKKLPFTLFGNDFLSDNDNYRLLLREQNYIMKMVAYRGAGMDIVDFSILSMLKIKNYSVMDVTIKVSNYTTDEIFRSIFAMLALGVIDLEVEQPVAQQEAVTVPVQQPAPDSNKSLLQKLMDRIKVK